MDILFADLDGTIIRSARTKRVGDIVIEYKDGAEISCISEECAALLPKLNFIPVTTRSVEQYKRISFPFGFSPKYAIIDNGGGLLVDGEVQPDHAKWAAGITHKCVGELARCRELLENDPDRSFEIRMVDGLFLFTKSDAPERTEERLGAPQDCEFYCTGAKVYVIPRRLNKGEGAWRLLRRFNKDGSFSGRVICAGDSEMDIPLLNIADIAIFPEDMAQKDIRCAVRLTSKREGFCEFVVKTAAEIMGIPIEKERSDGIL